MTLLNEFQVIIGSIFLGWLFMMIWSMINVFIKNIKPNMLRLIFDTPLISSFVYCYYLFLINTSDGVLNIFYALAIIFGIYLYMKFYDCYFSKFFILIKNQIKIKIIKPIYLKVLKIKDILKLRVETLKKRKRQKDERRKKKKQIN